MAADRISELKEKRDQLTGELLEMKEAFDRGESIDEQRIDDLGAQLDDTNSQIERYERQRERFESIEATRQRQPAARNVDWGGLPYYVDVRTGQRLECLNRDNPLPTLDPRFRMADAIRAIVLDDRNAIPQEQRAAFSISGAGVPIDWDRNWAQALGSRLAMVAAGADMVLTDSKQVNLTRVDTLPTTAWVDELEAVTPAEGTVLPVEATPARVSNIQNASREFIADSIDGAGILEQTSQQSMAEEVDSAGFNGNVKGPTGILNESGTQTLSTGAASWTNISDDIATMENAGNRVEGLSLIMNPTDYASLDQEQSTSGGWLGASPWAQKLRGVIASASMPAGSYVLGDFSHCVVVYRIGTELEWFQGGTSGSVNLLTQYASALRATSRVDVVLRQPGAFGVGTIS